MPDAPPIPEPVEEDGDELLPMEPLPRPPEPLPLSDPLPPTEPLP